MILESIFEPNFKNTSHGFRPYRSCHTALKQIHDTFTGAKWFVEGDIKACFDSFEHQIIIGLLRKRIEDEAFIQLIWKFLKAGYMEQWKLFQTYDGVPQGSGISPILSNIYLNELDKYMDEYKDKFNKGEEKLNPEYKRLTCRTSSYRYRNRKEWDNLSKEERSIRTKKLREMEKEIHSMTASIPLNENHKRLQYTRYADDFIIGVIGSKKDVENIKSDVKEFLEDKLKLILSNEKTKITQTIVNLLTKVRAENRKTIGFIIFFAFSNCSFKVNLL